MTQKAKPVEKEGDLVVFLLFKPIKCTECGAQLEKGDTARLEAEKALCLECLELDHLVFLPRGDVALTRRSKKYSTQSAVVVEHNRRRNRNERQGILAEADAIARAEDECAGDSEERAKSRERAAVTRERQDREYIARFTELVRAQYPKCPADEARTIAEHACQKYSGRVGRSAGAKEFDPDKITLAVRAHVRHVHTDYDALLAGGVDRVDARLRIARRLDAVVDGWR